MGYGWPEVTIAEVAQPVERLVEPIPGVMYRQVGVRLWGHGAYEREAIDGAATKYKSLNCVEAGDIIVNKIWARNGSVGVVTDDLAGCHGSGEFPTFAVDPRKLMPRWFHWITRTRWFWHRCDLQSRGTSGKNRIRPEKFLAIQIPLPPLSEQRRTVAKIDRLAEKIEEARGLRERSISAQATFCRSSFRGPFLATDGAQIVPLESLCISVTDCLHSNPVYSEIGIPTVRSPDVGWGTLNLASAKRTSEVEYERRTHRGRPEPGDVILVREGGGTGKAGIVPHGEKCSLGQRVMMLRVYPDVVLSKFLLYQWLSPLIQDEQIAARMKGSAPPHLNIKALRKFPFVLPSLAEQRRIVAYLDGIQAKVDAIKKLQDQTAAELDALLPTILDKAFKGEL